VITVEDLAAGDALRPVPQAPVGHQGSQCGFCTPGLLMPGLRRGAGAYDGGRPAIVVVAIAGLLQGELRQLRGATAETELDRGRQ
jgi:xanthine dehydrogenase iron-sulfur cluster and FAD-binding subunit A